MCVLRCAFNLFHWQTELTELTELRTDKYIWFMDAVIDVEAMCVLNVLFTLIESSVNVDVKIYNK